MAATYNTIISMTHISGVIIPPLEGGVLSPLEPNWTQVASTSPSVDDPGTTVSKKRTKPMLSHRLKQGVSYALLCRSVIFYRSNYLNLRPSRPKPASDEPADLLRSQRTPTQQQHVR